MRRLAAHFVWYKEVYRLHYVELQDDGTLSGVFPLTEEVEGTAFYDGVLVILPAGDEVDITLFLPEWRRVTGEALVGSPVSVYRLTGLSAAAAKLGTGDGGSYGHIERL